MKEPLEAVICPSMDELFSNVPTAPAFDYRAMNVSECDTLLIGAATQNTRPEGSVDKAGAPFGSAVNYGTLVMNLRKGQTSCWWQNTFDEYQDSLSRRTWAFALLATASEDIVLEHMANLAAVLDGASDDDFYSLAMSTSRLGTTLIPRRLGDGALGAAARYEDRLALVVSHFAAGQDGHNLLEPLTDEQLLAMSSPAPHHWSVAGAVTRRLLRGYSEDLLGALVNLGPDCLVEIGSVASPADDRVTERILQNPAVFPGSWVRAAESWCSSSNRESALAEEATDNDWVPNVPRI